MNTIQIIGKHSPLLATALEHNKAVEINPENVKTAINELLKVVLEEYTNKIVDKVKLNITEDDDTKKAKTYKPDIEYLSEVSSSVKVTIDKKSITNQLPLMLKELGI